MTRPIAVCISDIHFNVNTLSLASNALKSAIADAEELCVPLIVAGDLHDTKAIVRAEVMNELVDIFRKSRCVSYILSGNHDLINERSHEHGLTYLDEIPGVHVVDVPHFDIKSEVQYIPYQSSPELFLAAINRNAKILICHQGFKGAAMGDYVLDKTSVDPKCVEKYAVISGHYHRHQTLGTVTYIGSPYTITFGEANDGPKGYLVLYEDGSFDRRILNLRKHVIIDVDIKDVKKRTLGISPDDLLWLKVRGPYSELKKLNKHELGQLYIGHANYKLDLLPYEQQPVKAAPETGLTDDTLFDSIIDNESDTDQQKTYLKRLWREITSS